MSIDKCQLRNAEDRLVEKEGPEAARRLLARKRRRRTLESQTQSAAGSLRIVNSIISPGRSNQLSISVQ